MTPESTRENMSLDEALEAIFSVLQAMEAFVAVALTPPSESREDELAQQPAHLMKLFLTPLREGYAGILEHLE